MPLLTVGIPVFNAMPYLPESLDSILAQTFGDFEILVINDGSTDGSWEYLQSVRDRRLRLISQENRGLTATLNRMLVESNSPWLVRHDADDVAYPARLAITIDCINRYPEAGLFYSLASYYPQPSVGQFRTTKGSPAQIRALVLDGYLPSICHPTVTLNVDRASSVGGYRFNLHVEDIDLWWRMALRFDIRLIPEVTVGFRQNQQSVSSANLQAQALSTLYIQYLLLSHLWGCDPLPFELARTPLSQLSSPRRLQFKQHLRAFNMELGRGHRLKGLGEAVRALAASPMDFSSRVLDELIPKRLISVGETAALFARHQDTLWPTPRHAPLSPGLPVAFRREYTCGMLNEAPAHAVTRHAEVVPSFSLLGIRVHAMTKSDLIDSVDKAVQTHSHDIIGNHNLHSLYCWFHEPKMHEFHAATRYTHIDGMSLILLGRMLGLPLRRNHRTGYMDLLPSLAQHAAMQNWRIFYLGSKPGVAERGAAKLREQYPSLEIRTHHGHFSPKQSGPENQEVLAEINAFAPHVLFVGMGMPRQEVWILENKEQISANAVFCCGALMDYVAGEIPTPPRWLGRLGMEWLCRLVAEPNRLWRRYLVEPWFVIGQMTRQYLRSGRENTTEGQQK